MHHTLPSTPLIYRLSSSFLRGVSSFEKLFHCPPSYHFLKMFGCECFPLFLNSKNHKLKPKSKTCDFIGYALDYKGYRCFDPTTNKVFTSHHVIFHEHKFSYRALADPASIVPTYCPWSCLVIGISPMLHVSLHIPS